MRAILAITLLSCLSSCGLKHYKLKPGHYVGTCYLHRYPDVILQLSGDGVFHYRFAYNEVQPTGQWRLHRDTLFLRSTFFLADRQKELAPQQKYTDYTLEEDAFLVRKGRLFALDSLGHIREDCHLRRQVVKGK